jgi:hypothetical protein
MKKRLGILVLVFSSLVLSAACASSRPSGRSKPPQTQSEENWTRIGPSVGPRALPADSQEAR